MLRHPGFPSTAMEGCSAGDPLPRTRAELELGVLSLLQSELQAELPAVWSGLLVLALTSHPHHA